MISLAFQLRMQDAGYAPQDGSNPHMAPKTADARLSAAVQGNTEPQPRQCYVNSVLAFWQAVQVVTEERGGFTAEDDDAPPILYAEGYLVFPLGVDGGLLAIEHGWLETSDGRVIETTLREAAEGVEDWEYYTGLRLRLTDVMDRLERNGSHMPLAMSIYREGREGEIAGYAQAGQAAYWRAYSIDLGAGRADGRADLQPS